MKSMIVELELVPCIYSATYFVFSLWNALLSGDLVSFVRTSTAIAQY